MDYGKSGEVFEIVDSTVATSLYSQYEELARFFLWIESGYGMNHGKSRTKQDWFIVSASVKIIMMDLEFSLIDVWKLSNIF